MPAPPSLTAIPGGLNPSGGAPLSLPFVGQMQPAAGPNVVQAPGAASSASGPTTYTQSFTASQVGSLLVWIVAVNASAGAALGPTPAGWTLLWSQVQATLALGFYVYPNNPGGIASAVLSAPTATTGGIASQLYEIANCPFAAEASQSGQGSNTLPTTGALYIPQATNEAILGVNAWVAGVTLTPTNTGLPGLGWTNAAQQTSTGGTTNASLACGRFPNFCALPGAGQGLAYKGSLSGSAVWCAGVSSFQSTASDRPAGSVAVGVVGDVIAAGGQAISVGTL